MKIEIISGSPRDKSLTRRVALHLQGWLKEHSAHEVDLIDMKDWEVPAVQAVWVNASMAPASLEPLARRIFEADAFILVTPEYNGSYSPAMKNLIDHFPKQRHKPFGVVTASPGALGGVRASQQLLLLIPALFGISSPYLLVVPAVDKKFGPEGELLDASFQNSVNNFVTEFLWLSEKLVDAGVK